MTTIADRARARAAELNRRLQQRQKAEQPALTPSARMLEIMSAQGIPFFRFAMNQSIAHKGYTVEGPAAFALGGFGVEDNLADGGSGRRGQADADDIRRVRRLVLELRMEELVHVRRKLRVLQKRAVRRAAERQDGGLGGGPRLLARIALILPRLLRGRRLRARTLLHWSD